MPKTMTKYQLDHFKSKVRRNFNPLIEEQELLVKQYRAEATEKIVGKLAKKMGADKILDEFKKAEAHLKAVQDKARTFFKKKAEQDESKKKEYSSYRFDNDRQNLSLRLANFPMIEDTVKHFQMQKNIKFINLKK